MDAFAGIEAFGEVEVELLTDAYRVSGGVRTRFGRVTDILNQQVGTHMAIEHATIREHADPTVTIAAPSVLVLVTSVLLMSAPALTGDVGSDMRIQKRPARAQFAIPPVRVTGKIHVPPGSRPVDGLLNMTDRFLAMTDVTISSALFPDLGGRVAAAAVSRDRAQLLLLTDDEKSDELLADVLEENTAEAWLRVDEPPA